MEEGRSSGSDASGRRVLFICEPAYRWYLDGVIETLASATGCMVQVAAAAELAAVDAQAERIDLIVTIHSSVAAVIEFCSRRRGATPSLTIQDGIIEHRSSGHRVQGHFRYRPLCTDRIAVFGERSRRLIQLYGTEPDRIAVTGSPRFDGYFRAAPRLPTEPCLLITTANRSAYGQARLNSFYRLLVDLLRHCEHSGVRYRLRLGRGATQAGTEPIEKVSSGLSDDEIRFFRSLPISQASLQDDLSVCTAVVTTPSTVSLEAMAMGRPVAHLLFDPELVYLQSAWSIARAEDFATVLPELVAPPRTKMAFQQMVLEENLVTGPHATERVVGLIRDMLGSHDRAGDRQDAGGADA